MSDTRKLSTQSVVSSDYKIRSEVHQGRQHIVVPAVMMVEGVHNGSLGPLFHSAEELGHIEGAWNGIPVVIQHPQNNSGDYISANIPSQIEKAVGRVYNAHMDDKKLKGEVWLDVETLKKYSPETLGYIQQKRPLDVSVGVFTDELSEEGEWNGEMYIGRAQNHRPDHLALLPGGQGACSWADGCGIRVNEVNPNNNNNNNNGNNHNLNPLNSNNNEDSNSSSTKKSRKMKEKVERLIANTDSKFNNCDKEWLENLEEAKLDELLASYEKPKPKLELNEGTVLQYLKKHPVKDEQLVALLSKDVQDAHTLGLKLYQEKKDKMIKVITDNSKSFKKEELDVMDFELLEKISSSLTPDEAIQANADYSLMNGGSPQANSANKDEDNDLFLPRPFATGK